jgi:hypothetical protein
VGNERVRIKGAQQGKRVRRNVFEEEKMDKIYFAGNVNRGDGLVHSFSWCVKV